MAIVDDRILESLFAEGTCRPNEIRHSLASYGEAMAYSQTYIDERLDLLVGASLIRQADNGWSFELTQRGRLYLQGSFDAGVLSVGVSTAQSKLVDRIDD